MYEVAGGDVKQRDDIPALAGLRGLAAYIVFVSHFTNQTGFLGGALGHGAGQVGVMLFFALSGFLMAHRYFDAQPSVSEVGRYAQSRAARVLPLYLLVVLASFALPHWLYPVDSVGRLAEHLLMVKGVSVLWTIPVEVQFYALFPLFWLVAVRFGRVAVALLCVALMVWIYAELPSRPYQLTSHAHFFLGGMLAAVALPLVSLRGRLADAAFLVSIAALALLLPGIREIVTGEKIASVAQTVWADPMYLLCCVAALLSSVRSPLAGRLLGSGPAAFLGAISYSLYLLHLPILRLLASSGVARTPDELFFVANIAVVVVAAASFYWIERPAQTWFRFLTMRPQPYSAL